MNSLTNVISTYIISALMSNSLPLYVNPWLLFRHHETVNGQLSLAKMPNLRESQKRQDGEAKVSISVVKRDDGQIVIVGSASAELELECQRCLQPIVEVYQAPFELVLIKYPHQQENLSDEDDAIVVEDQLELAPLVEQELILALPMIAKHDDCQTNFKNSANVEAERQQPFANLKDLLN